HRLDRWRASGAPERTSDEVPVRQRVCTLAGTNRARINARSRLFRPNRAEMAGCCPRTLATASLLHRIGEECPAHDALEVGFVTRREPSMMSGRRASLRVRHPLGFGALAQR